MPERWLPLTACVIGLILGIASGALGLSTWQIVLLVAVMLAPLYYSLARLRRSRR